ncbi:MAG: response regulator, partial [Acidobacteriota bacterium]|nr:response regulator [Acidobacteriota bacterium]
EGMAAIEEERPDLVLLDVLMPHVDGWEMLRRMQERHGVGSIPVVMFSGKADEQAEEKATSRGAQAFVGKPFDLQELVERTKQLAPL